MTRFAKVAVAATLALGALPAASAIAEPAHSWEVRCGASPGPGAGWQNLRGYNTACSVARKLADAYVFEGDRTHRGWGCRDRQVGDELFVANCTRSKDGAHQHVRFRYGA